MWGKHRCRIRKEIAIHLTRIITYTDHSGHHLLFQGKNVHARFHACRGLKELPDGMMGFVAIVTRARKWRILRLSFTVSRSAVPYINPALLNALDSICVNSKDIQVI